LNFQLASAIEQELKKKLMRENLHYLFQKKEYPLCRFLNSLFHSSEIQTGNFKYLNSTSLDFFSNHLHFLEIMFHFSHSAFSILIEAKFQFISQNKFTTSPQVYALRRILHRTCLIFFTGFQETEIQNMNIYNTLHA
jgi:hypothetical protein